LSGKNKKTELGGYEKRKKKLFYLLFKDYPKKNFNFPRVLFYLPKKKKILGFLISRKAKKEFRKVDFLRVLGVLRQTVQTKLKCIH